MKKKAIEYECDVDEVLSSYSVGKASLGISGSSWPGRPPLRKKEIDGKQDRRRGGRVGYEK